MKSNLLRRLGRSLRSSCELCVWIGLGLSAITTLPATGAERIQFFYGPFEPTILVDDLDAIATDNAANVDAFWLEQLNEAQLAELQNFLNQRFAVDAVMMSQFTYSGVGESLLFRLGQIVQTESGLNGGKALRSAMILAAEDDQGLSILNIVRHFPLDTIQLDWSLVQQVIAENQAVFQQQETVIADLQQQAQASVELASVPREDLSQMGIYPWRQRVITFINSNRSAPSIADLYLPQRQSASIPVVVISHGVASNRQTFAYIAKHLASHGYAAVIIDHPETNTEKFSQFLTGLDGPPAPQSLLHRPTDISAVLDALEQQSATVPDLRSLNLDSVGVLGHSLGGYTALAAAGATLQPHLWETGCDENIAEQSLLNLSILIQCRFDELPEGISLTVQDDRVQAVIAMNPLTSHLFGAEGMATLTVPTMLVAGTDDYFVPALPEQIEPFQGSTVAAKYLVVVENGTHFTPLSAAEQVLSVPDFLIGPDPTSAQPALKALTLAFFNHHLSGLTDNSAFLTQTYLNQLASEPFQFSIVQQYGSAPDESY